MVLKQDIVFVNCIHNGCNCKRMFLLTEGEELPQYACIKHRRLHRIIPSFEDAAIKTGLILKRGDRSANYSKKCAVLLADRIVMYEKVGDPIPLSCINLHTCVIQQDEQVKRRFCIYNEREERPFYFEAILDLDYVNWFNAIQHNIELLGDSVDDFRSWDEDDYIAPGTPITLDIRRPPEFKQHHQIAMESLRKEISPRFLNSVKGDKGQTMSLNMWIGNWNMGECDPPFNLEEWVPNSFDIIAVGIEECMKLPDLEMRANGVIGNEYLAFTEKVGSVRKEVGFHGFIAMIVFVKIELIQCGFIPIQYVNTKNIALGKNLMVTRAANKGGVRVRIPFNLSILNPNLPIKSCIDFVCCHLAADQSGESKLEKRNKDAYELIQSLVCDTNQPQGFVFIVGDLNYRIDMDAQTCMQMIAEGVGNQDMNAFSALLDNDQLTSALASSASFPGFQELTLPAFPPTYKKKKGFPDEYDYSSLQSVANCYDYVMKDKTERTPSFTDRILYRSYLSSFPSMLFVYKYDCIDCIHDSDHTPLYGAVSLRIGPNCNRGPCKQHILPSVSRIETLQAIQSSLFFKMMISNRGNLQQMTAELINEILPFFNPSFIHENTVILKPGDKAICSLLFILKGSVKLITNTYELKELHPGDWFGGEALIDEVCGYTAIAQEDTVCLSLNINSMNDLMNHGYRDYCISLKRLLLGQSMNGLLMLLSDLIDNYDLDTLNLLRHQLLTVCKKKGKVLASEGEEMGAAFFIIAGQVVVTKKRCDGEDIPVAILGPGTVVGTETLMNGVVSNVTIKTSADSLLWILPRDVYQQYCEMDPQQKESAKVYDQIMYRWVNTNQLPIAVNQKALIELIEQLYDADLYDPDMIVWNPAKKGKEFRVLLSGRAVVGGEKRESVEEPVEENEFDLDVGAFLSSSKHQVVSSGCILNQFEEKVRCAEDCTVINVDKKQLKALCMLLRWKYFGHGLTRDPIIKKDIDYGDYLGLQICINELEGVKPKGATHVIITAVDKYGEPIQDEVYKSKDLRSAPFTWNENFRFGDGTMGVNVIAGLRVEIEQANGCILCEGLLGLDTVFDKFIEGRASSSVSMKLVDGKICSLFLSFKGLDSDIMSLSPSEVVLENIAMSRKGGFAPLPSMTPAKEENLLTFQAPKPTPPMKPQRQLPQRPSRPSKPLPQVPQALQASQAPQAPEKPSKPLPPKPPKAEKAAPPALPSKPFPPAKPTRPAKPGSVGTGYTANSMPQSSGYAW